MSAGVAPDRLPAEGWLVEPDTIRLVEALRAGGGAMRFVGGCVRDTIRGGAHDIEDIDVATPDPPDVVMRRLAAAGLRGLPTGIAHGTVTALSGARRFEVTTLRRDVETDGRHARVAFTDDWREDAARRDFTMNAMSADPDGLVHDYFGGREDLAAGCVRFVGDPAARIAEDRLRLLRFWRFHARFGRGAPRAEERAACRAAAPGLSLLSGERVRDEMLKLLAAADPAPSVADMAQDGILAAALGAGPFDDVEEVALEVLGRVVEADLVADLGAEGGQDLLGGFARHDGARDADLVGAGEQFVESALGLDAAAVIDDDSVAEVLDIGEEVGGTADGLAAAGEGDDEVLDLATAEWVEACGGFVEDDEVGIVDQGLSDADAALHALGELADGAGTGLTEADHLDELFGALAPFGGVELEQGSEEVERLAGVEVAVEVGLLGEVADAGLDTDVAGGLIEDSDGPLGWVEEAEHHLDGRGFSGAVGSEQTEDLAATDLEVDVVDGAGLRPTPEVLEDLGEAAHGDDGLGVCARSGFGLEGVEGGHGKSVAVAVFLCRLKRKS